MLIVMKYVEMQLLKCPNFMCWKGQKRSVALCLMSFIMKEALKG